MLHKCRRLDKAGIAYNFFYLTGISGKGNGEKGAMDTADMQSVTAKDHRG